MSRHAAAAFLAAAAFALGGCSRSASLAQGEPSPESATAPSDGAIAILSLHVGGFSADSSPDAASALASVVRSIPPDVLILQGMASADAFDAFQKALAGAGLDPYPHAALFKAAAPPSLAYLSRIPVAADLSHADDSYTIGPERLPVQHGFLDITLAPPGGRPLRILAADLKDKEFHPLAQAEMRRSEARLLANHVRAALRDDPSARLLVCGALHDSPSSAALRTLLDASKTAPLADLRPADPFSHAWTCQLPDDSCERSDYLLASPALLPSVTRTTLLDTATLSLATPHRPLLLTLSP